MFRIVSTEAPRHPPRRIMRKPFGRPNAQAEARATPYRLTPAKNRPLWPVASSAVLGPYAADVAVQLQGLPGLAPS